MPESLRILIAIRGGQDYREWLQALSAALIREGVRPSLVSNPHALAEHALAELGRRRGLGDPPARTGPRGRPPRNIQPPGSHGDVLRKRRLAVDLTQSQVAERLGVHSTHYARWEQGRCRPSPRYRERLELILGPPRGTALPVRPDGSILAPSSTSRSKERTMATSKTTRSTPKSPSKSPSKSPTARSTGDAPPRRTAQPQKIEAKPSEEGRAVSTTGKQSKMISGKDARKTR